MNRSHLHNYLINRKISSSVSTTYSVYETSTYMQVEAAPGNVLEEAKKLGLNTLLSLVNAAGLSEQVTDSTYEYSAIIGQCCWTL